MARLEDLDPDMATFLRDYECPNIDTGAWQAGPAADARRVSLVSSAGLRRRDDRPFSTSATDYRIIPLDKRREVVQDHVNAGHDRTGFSQDLNVAFPLDRLVELAEQREIDSVADYHYSFMGATDATAFEPAARELARNLRGDGVNAVVLCPV